MQCQSSREGPLFATLFVLVTTMLASAQETPAAVNKPPEQSFAPAAAGSTEPPRRMAGPPPADPFAEAKAIPQPKNEAELAAAIKQLARALAASGRFSGSVLVAADGKPQVDNAWGEADREHRVANTPATAYDVGSLGKLFTQIAILQLLDAGKLSLDEAIGEYLTNYPNRDVAESVTIRQLLLHTSGLGDFLESITPATNLGALRELRDFLPLFVDKPLEFPPGSKTRYSNTGYMVLGLVIEAVSKQDYYQYVEQKILKPAGMTHSGFFDRTKLPDNVAHSYDDGRDVTNMHAVRGSPAGGLQASGGDLLRLVQAIDAGKLLKKESVKLLRDLVPHPPNTPPPADDMKLASYGIAGGAPGVSAQLSIDPSGRYTRVILCNGSPPMAMSMGATIREWLVQMPR
jgi:D-alanyl-D-alanine carboxypeptidase